MVIPVPEKIRQSKKVGGEKGLTRKATLVQGPGGRQEGAVQPAGEASAKALRHGEGWRGQSRERQGQRRTDGLQGTREDTSSE